jgi:hypothetical protein
MSNLPLGTWYTPRPNLLSQPAWAKRAAAVEAKPSVCSSRELYGVSHSSWLRSSLIEIFLEKQHQK